MKIRSKRTESLAFSGLEVVYLATETPLTIGAKPRLFAVFMLGIGGREFVDYRGRIARKGREVPKCS